MKNDFYQKLIKNSFLASQIDAAHIYRSCLKHVLTYKKKSFYDDNQSKNHHFMMMFSRVSIYVNRDF